jgi:aminocarboxymuconate-semialdehyde decarboxylase
MEYLGKFWLDCITHDADTLEFILKKMGSNRVCLGSDYPFPLGDLEIGKFIEEMNLPRQTVDDIFCNSSLEWLGLNANDFA